MSSPWAVHLERCPMKSLVAKYSLGNERSFLSSCLSKSSSALVLPSAERG